MRRGEYTGLAEVYQQHRAGYSPSVLLAVASRVPRRNQAPRVADIGAGTGIWSRQVAAHFGHCVAIEPNDDMRHVGRSVDSESITWKAGTAEDTGEPDNTYDWVTMASAFHWANTEAALTEFRRILKPAGLFTCVWNPRIVKGDPLLEGIETAVNRIVPPDGRRSSGSSRFVEDLSTKLEASGKFTDVSYIEDRCCVSMTRERYLGLWRSVNEIQALAGPERFERLMQSIEEMTAGVDTLECWYRTRAWTARRV